MNYVFIVGCPRSGTSILGELVACHRKIQYHFETRNVWQEERFDLARERFKKDLHSHRLTAENNTEEDAKRIRQFFRCRENICNPFIKPREFMRWLLYHYHSKEVVVEKNPRNALRIPYILSVFPEAKFIHIIRDGRDVTCSLLPGIGGKDWNHARPNNWRELSKLPPLKRCALTWQEIVMTADKDLNELPESSRLLVRYENLILNTNNEVLRLFNFLNLSITPEIISFIDNIQNETIKSYHARHQEYWYQPNHSVRVGRWKQNLTMEQQNDINHLIGDTLLYFGYYSNN